jgi:hypothetical protein
MSVSIDASSNNIVRGNVIGGRAAIIDQGACCNDIIDNRFGVTPDGRFLERQVAADAGIVSHQSFNRIAGNIFGGINYSAVRAFGIGDDVTETIVSGNTFLGITPTKPILGGAPIDVDGASRTFLGGTTEPFRNRINAGATAISIHRGVQRTFILGNSIGSDDLTGLRNGNGIDAAPSEFTFIQNNVIANNTGIGVIAGAAATRIRRNSVYGNQNGAIASSTARPVITSATSTSVSGTACANCTVEIFSDDESQARFYEGTTSADGSGRFTFSKSAIFRAAYVTATATDATGATSALSAPFAAPPPPPRRRSVRH